MFSLHKRGGVWYYTIDSFDQTGLVRHSFTTRRGGVSAGIYESMNLRFHSEDARENVLENFKRSCEAIGADVHSVVLSHQVHRTDVVAVTKKDCGNGIFRENAFQSADGLMTNEPGVTLSTYYADCVPIYFLDPVHRAIALVHSGWRGTAERIGQVAVERMQEQYGTKPDDLLAAVGPCIGVCHFEVGNEVSEIFRETFGEEVLERHEKWHVNLPLSVQKTLLSAGIPAKNITMAEICTYCHSDLLFSHRKTNGNRGNLGAFLALK